MKCLNRRNAEMIGQDEDTRRSSMSKKLDEFPRLGADVLEAAKFYLQTMRWVPIPIPKNEKGPKLPGWQTKCNTANLTRTIEKWFDGHDGNIGIVCGFGSGVAVVDIDVKNGNPGLENWKGLEAKHGKLVRLVGALTPSGGRHYFFKAESLPFKSNAGQIANGIDLRAGTPDGDGVGQVLVCPSTVNGGQYNWIEDKRFYLPTMPDDLPDAPEWLAYLACFKGREREQLDADADAKASILAAPRNEWRALLDKHLTETTKTTTTTRKAKQVVASRDDSEERNVDDPYIAKSLQGIYGDIRKCRQDQNDNLNKAAFRAGQLLAACGNGDDAVETVQYDLFQAAMAMPPLNPTDPWNSRDGRAKAQATIKSGLSTGLRKPADNLPDRNHGRATTAVSIEVADPKTGELVTVTKTLEYQDRLANGQPDPKSRRNVQQFCEAAGVELWCDEFARKYYMKRRGLINPVNDAALLELMYAMRETGLKIDKDPAKDAIEHLAHSNPKHPVKDYLNGLKWDGKTRVDTWLARYAGVKDTALHRAYGRKFLIAGVRRLKAPGEMVRTMPILEGAQNIGKSKIFRTLAIKDDWFTDNLDMGASAKEVIENTAGKWIVEAAELSGMAKRDLERVKAFYSRTTDSARLAYGRFAIDVPRQFVMGGTTNNTEYLKDRTGNTRFWGIRVGELDIEGLRRNVDQLWAEALNIEATGEPHWLDDPDLIVKAEKAATKREEVSPVEQRWIDVLTNAADDWFIPANELFKAAGLGDVSKRTQAHNNGIAFAAKRVGWQNYRKSIDGDQVYGYIKIGENGQTAQVAEFSEHKERLVKKGMRTLH